MGKAAPGAGPPSVGVRGGRPRRRTSGGGGFRGRAPSGTSMGAPGLIPGADAPTLTGHPGGGGALIAWQGRDPMPGIRATLLRADGTEATPPVLAFTGTVGPEFGTAGHGEVFVGNGF